MVFMYVCMYVYLNNNMVKKQKLFKLQDQRPYTQ